MYSNIMEEKINQADAEIMGEYKIKGDDSCMQTVNAQSSQPKQSENHTENTKEQSDSFAAISDTFFCNNPMHQTLVPNANHCTCKTSLPERKWQNKGSFGMTGFMFWTHSAGVVLLLVGFVSPGGWLASQTYQNCHLDTYSSYDRGNRFRFFSYSKIVRAQALYTAGLLISLCTMCVWYKSRKDVTEGKRTGLSKKKWFFLFVLTALSATVVLVPVFSYTQIAGRISDVNRDDLYSPVGVVVAGLGGGMMVLCSVTILMYLMFKNNDDDSMTQVPEEEKNV